MFAVSQYDASNVTYTQAIHHDSTGWNLTAQTEYFSVCFQHLSDCRDDDMIFINSHLFCNHRIFSQVLVFTVYRQDIFWSC